MAPRRRPPIYLALAMPRRGNPLRKPESALRTRWLAVGTLDQMGVGSVPDTAGLTDREALPFQAEDRGYAVDAARARRRADRGAFERVVLDVSADPAARVARLAVPRGPTLKAAVLDALAPAAVSPGRPAASISRLQWLGRLLGGIYAALRATLIYGEAARFSPSPAGTDLDDAPPAYRRARPRGIAT
jgi:hypothetical protein